MERCVSIARELLHQMGFMSYLSSHVQNVGQYILDAGIDSPYAPRVEFTCFMFAAVTASKTLPTKAMRD